MPQAKLSFHDYYWGRGPVNGPSFRDDINRIVPPERKRTSSEDTKFIVFDMGLLFRGESGDFLKGPRRDQFLVALFFTALIDQGLHYYYPAFHHTYDRLTAPPKLSTTIFNVRPDFLFEAQFGWDEWTQSRLETFREAQEVFRVGFLDFAQRHMPELNAEEAWAKFIQHLPQQAR